jgi:hypothetical protein
MVQGEEISKTLKMMHDAANREFDRHNYEKGIDILNDAHVLEKKLGFKGRATESMLEIASAYEHLQNYQLALWFAEEALDTLPSKHEASIRNKIYTYLNHIKEKTEVLSLSLN